MDWLTEPFQHEFMRRVFVGGALIGFTAGFLGAFIVLRRLALMADSLSHSLLPGLAVGFWIFGLAPMGLFFGALVAALMVAVGAQLIARSSRLKEDTAQERLLHITHSADRNLYDFELAKPKEMLLLWLMAQLPCENIQHRERDVEKDGKKNC